MLLAQSMGDAEECTDTDTFRRQVCGAMIGITGMWDTTVRGSFECKLLRACGSRRVHVSPVVQSCVV